MVTFLRIYFRKNELPVKHSIINKTKTQFDFTTIQLTSKRKYIFAHNFSKATAFKKI